MPMPLAAVLALTELIGHSNGENSVTLDFSVTLRLK